LVEEIISLARESVNGTVILEQHKESRFIPDCDLEEKASYRLIDKDINGEEWKVLDWTWLSPSGKNGIIQPFGTRGSTGIISNWIEFSLNETALAFTRNNWQYGRAVRSGLSFILGIEPADGNSNFVEKLPDGIEIEVEHSVITGPTGYEDTS